MLELTLKTVVLCILFTAPFALWGVLCALTAIDVHTTPPSIAAGFFSCAIGWGGLIAAGIDYLIGVDALFWPVGLLLGVLMLSIGNAVIYAANRRTCACPSCTGRVHQLKGVPREQR